MSIKGLNHSLIVLIAIVALTACSNSSPKNATKNKYKKKTVIHRVKAKPSVEKKKETEVYASLLDQWNKEDLADTIKASPKAKKPIVKVKPHRIKRQ